MRKPSNSRTTASRGLERFSRALDPAQMHPLGVFVVAALLSACAPVAKTPDLASLYNRSAQYHGPERNPVIVIPGILGSRLADPETGEIVWGAFERGSAKPNSPDGARLLALPMAKGKTLAQLRDGVVAEDVLDRLRLNLLGLPLQLNAYREIILSLGAGGYRDENLALAGAVDYGSDHFGCFQFPYDWRRDNIENARLLHEFILQKRRYVQGKLAERYGVSNYPVKFDIVAHSMGGLVARYYLRYGAQALPEGASSSSPTWAGARYVDRVVLVGTPNGGSLQAILQLIHGIRFAPFLPKYEPALLGTMPSVYQLLPRPRHKALVNSSGQPVDFLDIETWIDNEWGLADPKQDHVLQKLLTEVSDAGERRAIALDHLDKSLARARQFFAALDTPATPPSGPSFYLVAGDADQTPLRGVVDRSGDVQVSESAFGDGTVTRASALMDERLSGNWSPDLRSPIAWREVTFYFKNHLGVTKDPAFTDNLLFILLEKK